MDINLEEILQPPENTYSPLHSFTRVASNKLIYEKIIK